MSLKNLLGASRPISGAVRGERLKKSTKILKNQARQVLMASHPVAMVIFEHSGNMFCLVNL